MWAGFPEELAELELFIDGKVGWGGGGGPRDSSNYRPQRRWGQQLTRPHRMLRCNCNACLAPVLHPAAR